MNPLKEQNPQSSDDSIALSPAVLKMLWGAMVFSIVVYGVVGYIMVSRNAIPPGKQLDILLYVLGGLSLLVTFFATALAPRFRHKLPGIRFHVLRWVLSETIAIFGLFLLLSGGSFTVFSCFLGWSLLLILSFAPTRK